MPKPAAHALIWCADTSIYTVRDPKHDTTLAATFGDALTLTPECQEWFVWLASISSFAFEGRAGRFTARRETKQRGESYWIAYQRCRREIAEALPRQDQRHHCREAGDHRQVDACQACITHLPRCTGSSSTGADDCTPRLGGPALRKVPRSRKVDKCGTVFF